MKEKINVLSLFDGISAGQLALQRAGIEVNNYYASEIDKYAIQVTQKNFPNTIQLGDITKWQEWDIDWSKIDLVIGGSPCQGFSFAGKQLNFDDPRSKLFFVFVDICHRVIDENPKMKFLLENVRMKKEYQDVITKYMGVEPVAINSSLVSAQNRYRLYWTNISNVTQPNDLSILFKDIIEDNVDEKYYYSKTVLDRIDISEIEHVGMVGYKSKGKEMDKCGALLARHYKGMQSLPYPIVKQSVLIVPEATKKGYTEVYPNEGVDLTFINSTTRRGRRMEDKSNCLTAANYDYCWYDGYICRKLTPIECERLQTFPDNWTEGISNSQRYKALGNSWTVDVIAHIFKGL